MLQLTIDLLGPLQIKSNGGNLAGAFRTKKERALLAYLAVEAGRAHRREALAEMFWPDRPDGYARTNLRQALSGLRRALGPDALEISDEFVRFVSAASSLDLTAFDAHHQFVMGHPHENMGNCAACAQRLEQMIKLYRGEFLEDIFVTYSQNFQEWIVFHREQYFRKYLSALSRLTEHLQNQARFEQAYKYAWQYVSLAPLEENAHRLLMNLLAMSGRRTAALEQYQVCRRILANELGVEPSGETVTLYEKIKLGVQLNLDTQILRLELTNIPAPNNSFFGRDVELMRLDDFIQDENSHLIVISGMPGTGKTRLAQQSARSQAQAFSDGVWYLSAANMHTRNELAVGILQTISLPQNNKSNPVEQALELLCPMNLLLVLDDFEPLIDLSSFLHELVDCAVRVKLMVVSRVRLNTPSASAVHLEGLPCPGEGEGERLMISPAVQLFLARVQRTYPNTALWSKDLPNILQICRLAGGLPLGIELAAANLRELSYEQVIQRLATDLEKLTNPQKDVPRRQRSLAAALEPAWWGIEQAGQQALGRLLIFDDEFSMDAAQTQAGVDLDSLIGLADQSMLSIVSPGRYRIHPVVRTYCAWKQARNGNDSPELSTSDDHLLSLPDRKIFWDRVSHTIARASRINIRFAVLIVALEQAERMDGQHEGMKNRSLLGVLGMRLAETLRKSDTIAYLGMEKFGLITEEVAGPHDFSVVMDKIQQAVEKPLSADGAEYRVLLRTGASLHPRHGKDAQILLERAESALQTARQENRLHWLFEGQNAAG